MIVLKVTTDIKTGQKVRTVRLTPGGSKLRIFGEIDYDVEQMMQLAQFGVDVIKRRVSLGIGSADGTMPGLKRGYAIRKQRAGAGNRRNLQLTGAMLSNFTVRSVSATRATMGITSQKERIKALANERRAPWFGWSARDLVELIKLAEILWKVNVANVGIGGTGRGFARGATFLRSSGGLRGAVESRAAA